MEQDMASQFDEMMQSLKDSYELTVRFSPVSHDGNVTSDYLRAMEDLCSLKENARQMQTARLQTIEQTQSSENYEDIYQNNLKKLTAKTFYPKRSKAYKEFNAYVQSLEGTQQPPSENGMSVANSDDSLIVEGTVNVLDPLSKVKMTNPVRNTMCGHHYEKTTILAAIKVNKKICCPVAGCGNANPIDPSHLIDDKAFQMRILHMPEL